MRSCCRLGASVAGQTVEHLAAGIPAISSAESRDSSVPLRTRTETFEPASRIIVDDQRRSPKILDPKKVHTHDVTKVQPDCEYKQRPSLSAPENTPEEKSLRSTERDHVLKVVSFASVTMSEFDESTSTQRKLASRANKIEASSRRLPEQ